jgi:hypothetical protein
LEKIDRHVYGDKSKFKDRRKNLFLCCRLMWRTSSKCGPNALSGALWGKREVMFQK